MYVAEGCDRCSEVSAWLRARRPAGLGILAAEAHPTRDLTRMRYEAADGTASEGLAAFARALEHVHLGWAWVGWTARLPLLRALLQLVLDGVGAGPRRVSPRRSSEACPTRS